MPPTHPSQADVAAAYRTLIAHETEPKEQDFYRTRLQRLEPRTEPESDDFVTQLAVKQIEGEAAWWRSIDFDRNASRTFESMTGDSQQAVRTGVERVLAHLTAAGRLIPAGGMALTAEQVEDVRIVLGLNGSQDIKVVLDAQARLRALFPATEPTSYCSKGVCSANEGHDGTCAEASGWAHDAYEDDPAPAEPAEEETKAEDEATLAARAEGWYEGYEVGLEYGPIAASGEEYDGPINPYDVPASSPVVPAPTETGPWMHADEIPNDVTVVTDRDKRTWKYSSRTDKWTHRSHGQTRWVYGYPDPCFAPFVAAEEG